MKNYVFSFYTCYELQRCPGCSVHFFSFYLKKFLQLLFKVGKFILLKLFHNKNFQEKVDPIFKFSDRIKKNSIQFLLFKIGSIKSRSNFKKFRSDQGKVDPIFKFLDRIKKKSIQFLNF